MKKYGRIHGLLLMVCMVVLFAMIPSVGVKAGDAGKDGTVTLSKSVLSLAPSQSVKIKAKVKGLNSGIVWSTSNKYVATVDQQGRISAKSSGICYITAKNGKKSAKCKVYVYTKKIYSNDFYVSGTAVSYYTGQNSADKYADLNKSGSEAAWHVYSSTQSEFLECSPKKVVKTRRQITLGMTKSEVKKAYGQYFTESGVTISTDGVYHVLSLGDTTENFAYANLVDIQKATSCVAYKYERNGKEYQIRFYFDRDNKLLLIAYVKGYEKLKDIKEIYTY